MRNQIFVLRVPKTQDEEEWRIFFEGKILSPSFNCRGAAQIYLNKLNR